MIEELKTMAKEATDQEIQQAFASGEAAGYARGRKELLLEVIRKLEAERKVVDIGSKKAETAAKGPQAEKR